jgi:hypothetical protein
MLSSTLPCHHTETMVNRNGTIIRYNEVEKSSDSPFHITSKRSDKAKGWLPALHTINTTFATMNINTVSK